MSKNMLTEEIKGYRADPKGLFGGKDRLETLPTKLSKSDIYSIMASLKDAESLGVPKLTDKQLANMFLTEGRSDAGYNSLNYNNKKAVELAAKMRELGHSDLASGFAGAVLDKAEVAKRTKKSFDEVWNGTGKSVEGRTGAQHAQRLAEGSYAPDVERNKDFMGFLKAAREGSLSEEEKYIATFPQKEKNLEIFNGLGPRGVKRQFIQNLADIDPSAAQYFEKIPDRAIYDLMLNEHLKSKNIAERPINQGFLEVVPTFQKPSVRPAVDAFLSGSFAPPKEDLPWYINPLAKAKSALGSLFD
jgi:hypothetical protein